MRLVLDTNVVLDWLVFGDASTLELRRAVADKQVAIITHAPAVDELRRVLAYPQCELALPDQQGILQRYQAQTSIAAWPEGFGPENLRLPKGFPRCRDRDDEHFIALAYHARVDALVTRDKEILRLSKRAARFGVTMLSATQLAAALHAIVPASHSRSAFSAPVRP